MLTAMKALARVQAAAEKVRNDETASVGTVSRGDVVRQGDLYVVCITGREPRPEQLRRTEQRQLAPGDTQGSRHVLIGECEVYEPLDRANVIDCVQAACPPAKKALAPDRDEPLIGPVFRTREAVELDHPEHGNRVLPAGEWFAVVYQRALAEETRRQQD